MTIAEMKEKKIERGLSNKQLAELSGVPLGTLQRLFAGKTKMPRRDTVEALTKALEEPSSGKTRGTVFTGTSKHKVAPEAKIQPGRTENRPSGSDLYSLPTDHSFVRETPPQYGRRLFTLDDYLALPEEQRVELINGVFYNMAAPTTLHQMIIFLIQKSLWEHVEKKGGPCFPLASPVDVVLDHDQYTVIQPDVLVVCDRDKFRDDRVYGAPDLVVEVLSPSTRRKDISLKLYKYAEAGVREYWIVDPPARQIAVFDLEHLEDSGRISVYGGPQGTSLKVPVLIWNKEHEVDFETIFSLAAPLET